MSSFQSHPLWCTLYLFIYQSIQHIYLSLYLFIYIHPSFIFVYLLIKLSFHPIYLLFSWFFFSSFHLLRTSSISTLNCCSIFQHFLFHKTIIKVFADLQFFSWIIRILLKKNLLLWSSFNLSRGPGVMWVSIKKIVSDRFSPSDVYRLQTSKPSIYIYYIDKQLFKN